MNPKKASDCVNSLLSLAVFTVDRDHERPARIHHTVSGFPIAFLGINAVSGYQEKVEWLYAMSKEIKETYSFDEFEKKIISLLETIRVKDRQSTETDIKTLSSEILSLPIVKFEIFTELYGGSLKETKTQLGEFTVYSVDKLGPELLEKYPRADSALQFIKSKCLLAITVTARDKGKAEEIAESYFHSFENIINYVIADISHKFSFGVFSADVARKKRFLIITESGLNIHGQNKLQIDFDLQHEHLNLSSQGHDLIWNIITKKNKSELEKRILKSAEWIGKAMRESDLPKSLYQLAIAVECMLKVQEKELITPSIVSQLSEWLAFIISEESEKRKAISGYFKEVYAKRSVIAHGGDILIEEQDVLTALDISKSMIICLLTKAPFNTFSNLTQLQSYITDLKFK